MSFEGHEETLETLEALESFVSQLSPDLTDKKTISDVMLALEKIQPDIKNNLSAHIAAMCEVMALLYEKFLMEMVADAAPGIDLTSRGLAAIRSGIEGTEDSQALDFEAIKVIIGLRDEYSAEIAGFDYQAAADILASEPEPADEAAPAEETAEETAGEESDDFFSGMADATPPAPQEDDAAPLSPAAEKLNQLANDITMLDPDMTDKKLVSDIMLELEQIRNSMMEEGLEPEVTGIATALSALYEKCLMEGIKEGQKAIDMTADAIVVLSSYFENVHPDDLFDQAISITKQLAVEFGLDIPEAAPPPADQGAAQTQAPAAEPVAAAPAPAAEVTVSSEATGVDTIKVATEEDLLIYTEFVTEVTDAVANIEEDLLELEEDPTSEDLINNLFRAYHSMKGAAGFLGVNAINILCHEAETLLDKFRKKIMVCNQNSIDALLKAVDVVKLVNEGLNTACQKAKTSIPDATLQIPRFDIAALLQLLSDLSSRKVEEIEVKSEEDKDVAPLGQILVEEGKVSSQQVESALEVQKQNKHLGEILVDMGAVDEKSIEKALENQADKKKKAAASTLKIDTEKLDSLLELVGELVISQSIVSQDTVLLEEGNRAMLKNIMNLGKITKNIQDHVMTLRMVPLKQTFQKMSRLVRDLSKKMNKPVNFKVTGEDTEIDKTLIEQLNDPLVHLLRNAMDHGLEDPAQREADGKSKTGSVNLNAFHQGGNVYIEVVDDGKGLDEDRVRVKAIEKGLIAEDSELAESEIYNLIMMPGFSTHDVATDVSGRGVGMDVVRSNIDALGGRLDITSKHGKGSTFTLRLPLTMAIVDGMIVKIGGDRYVIPTISIRESIRPKKEEIATFKGEGEMLDVRGRLLPLVRLHKFLGFMDREVHLNPWEGLVIIVESDKKEFGFMVDDLLGQQQVVIKSLDKRFKGLPGISGGTILGDGQVGLILDVSSVVAVN